MSKRGEHKRKYAGRKKQEVRAERVAVGLLAGKSDVAAVRDAGFSPETARTHAYDIVRRPLVQSKLTEALEACGITAIKAAQVVADGLAAKMIVFNPDTGEGIFVDQPAHAIRLKAYDRWVQAYGYVPRQIEMPPPPSKGLTVLIRQANIQVNPGVPSASPSSGGNGEDRHATVRVTIRPATGEGG